ncbi:replication associated protein, partial [Lake Sarah-associated circular virus-8]|uniref:replication associated protein n=1 Tax=Lake Sarah-associated circular virus-8 TaxID=1685785 RepID=UPI0007772CD8
PALRITPTHMATNNKFSLQAKRFFLTFPQCPMDKHQVLLWLTGAHEAHQAIVAEEQHEDGSPHLHIYLTYEKAKRISHADYFDLGNPENPEQVFHPNIQTVKNMKECVKYITKTDKEPAQHNINYRDIIAGKSSKFAVIAASVMDGKSLLEINDSDPGFVLQHKRKLEEYQAWIVMKKPRNDLAAWYPVPVPAFGPEYQLATWLNANLFAQPRRIKASQLYLFSPPNCGKTTLITWLSRFCRIYYMPLLEDFYDFYDDDSYDLVVIDEFKGQKQIQFLNQWLDGQPCTVRIKGGQRLKTRNLPCIILSNWALSTVYSAAIEKSGPDVIGPLIARLEIVNVNKFITFYDPVWVEAQNKEN